MQRGELSDDAGLHGSAGHAANRAPIPSPPDDRPAAAPVDFDDFYRTERARTLAVAAGLVGDWDIAEDVVQESFAEAYRRWSTVRDYDKPGAWLRRVALNRAISRVRRRRVELRVLGRLGARPAEQAEDPVADAELWAAVRRLPRRQAEVVALTYIEDLTMPQVAEILGCTRESVKTHLQRARQRLARELPDPRQPAGEVGDG